MEGHLTNNLQTNLYNFWSFFHWNSGWLKFYLSSSSDRHISLSLSLSLLCVHNLRLGFEFFNWISKPGPAYTNWKPHLKVQTVLFIKCITMVENCSPNTQMQMQMRLWLRKMGHEFGIWTKLRFGTGLGTLTWIYIKFTPPTSIKVFYRSKHLWPCGVALSLGWFGFNPALLSLFVSATFPVLVCVTFTPFTLHVSRNSQHFGI